MALVLLRTPSSYSPPSATAPLLPFTTACRSPSRVPSSAGHWKRVRGLRIASGSGRGLALTHADTSGDLKEIRDCCTVWKWKDFDVNYLVKGKGPPLLLVHGFGASVGHWRRSEAKKKRFCLIYCPSSITHLLVRVCGFLLQIWPHPYPFCS